MLHLTETMSSDSKQVDRKSFAMGCGAGLILSSALYVGYKLYSSSYAHKRVLEAISKKRYADDDEINSMLHACAAIIETTPDAYLGTLDMEQTTPCCRIIDARWKPPISIPYIHIGSNKTSRKYQQLQRNNNVCVIYGDFAGAGFVSLYGKMIEMEDTKRAKSMFPVLWNLFFRGPSDPRYVMFTLYIEKIEFVSHRFDYDTGRKDWKPHILKRVPNTLFSERAEWEIEESPVVKLN